MRIFLVVLFLCGALLPATAAELIHPGDSLRINVWQDPKLDRTVIVGPKGTFGFPLAGHIRAAGRTPQAIEQILKSRLKKNYTGTLDITVTLGAINQEQQDLSKPRVYVTGEVLRPGPYDMRPHTTVAQAIALAGGLGPFAARQRIQVHRKMRGVDTIFLFNFNAYESGRIATDNIDLRSGDIIIVPERGLFE
jgi:polysaccharide export outer membrane protein